MFRSQAMYKVDIVVPEHDIIGMTDALAATEAFHVSDTPPESGDVEMLPSSFWPDRLRRCLALEQRLLDLMSALDVSEEVCHDEMRANISSILSPVSGSSNSRIW